MFSRKNLLSAFVVAALSTTALTPLASVAVAAEAAAPAILPGAVEFAQAHSDIKPDAQARYGRLPNGLTYIIYPNKTPPGVVSLRMRFATGSMMESEAQLGLAHFLEHMAFNGSKNVPEGDMVKILERHGLKFGPDTNAYTSFDETVYMLDLPKNDEEIIDTGLFLFRETAGNLTLDPKAIDKERGVVLGEERARNSPGLRAYIGWAKAAFPGQLYGERLPIGSTKIIAEAPAQAFVDYYNDFYRPELTTIIVAGDIDADQIEAKIKAKFSDLTPRSKRPLDKLSFGTYGPQKTLNAYTYAEAGLSNSLQVSWFKPFDDSWETEASDFTDMLDDLAFAVVNQRLERLAKSPDSAFSAASVGNGTITRTAEAIDLDITPKPGKDKEAYQQALTVVRQFETYGATDEEVARVLANWTATQEAAAKREKTRDTGSIVNQLVGTLGDKEVMTAPSQDLAFFNKIKPRLTTAAVSERAKTLFSGDGPMVAHMANDLGGFDKAALLATHQTLLAQQVDKPATTVKKAWPYETFGKAPAAIVKETVLADIGVTQLVYANGVRVNIKPTDFKDNEVLVNIRFDGGLTTIGQDKGALISAANWTGLREGGLGKLDSEEIKDTLAGRLFGTGFGIGDEATVLSGSTTPDDFGLQMQVLTAFTTDPGFREAALERIKSQLPNLYQTITATPSAVFSTKGPRILRNGDKRFGLPEQDAALAVKNDEIKALVSGILSNAPIEITIVGDITVEDVKKVLATTFATLPKRAEKITPVKGADTLTFPKTNLHQVLTHTGRADQNISFIAWPTTDFFANTQEARATELLAEVLTLRLTEEIREKQGASYGSSAGSTMSSTFKGFGYLSASATVKPEVDQTFFDSVMVIADDLKAKPITEDELLRARKPVLDRYDVQVKTNGYWIGALPGIQADPRDLAAIRSRKAELLKVTPADIQTEAKKWLVKEKVLRIQVKPADKPAEKAADKPAS
ncbi:insulinase family protein [Asticcacaulis sp. BYS171W]|uniref:Insulinase family protein n=1 Tax=Asticcacaulis aquaticus TaxID=2984212 RepID=A0ABT5HYU3_9CAUL|nr:insulinase family protein [Asticcacaulis aquaticus]MDC7685247.1 insulinase family protein [Asticcacaulis aquaticus]